jgi:pyrroloquinoline quinone biosynthesis protein B
MKKYYPLFLIAVLYSCGQNKPIEKIDFKLNKEATSLIILGTIQDAGSPHIACKKDCCKEFFHSPDIQRQVVALGLIDNEYSKKYLFEATPDIPIQMKSLVTNDIENKNEIVDGIFLTHAHIGHYTGLMYLGKEAIDAKNTPVFAMPRMKNYLESNGPWDLLVSRNNIRLTKIENSIPILLTPKLTVTPFLVPHRDEYSETVGYKIQGPKKTALFIPDIDKWGKWNENIIEEIKKVDYAFIDATFYSGQELNNRDISQIPHPFITESLKLFASLDTSEKNKIIFIHFNHTNPVINLKSKEAKNVIRQGFKIAQINDVYEL